MRYGQRKTHCPECGTQMKEVHFHRKYNVIAINKRGFVCLECKETYIEVTTLWKREGLIEMSNIPKVIMRGGKPCTPKGSKKTSIEEPEYDKLWDEQGKEKIE